jgi:hypothetical protein
MAEGSVTLLGCGDVGPTEEPIAAYTTLVKPVLATGDIRFGQCERVYSERGSMQIHSEPGPHSRVKPHMATVFSDCGFDVISLASNHSLDWGEDALLDTLELFHKKGIQTIGAGHNIEEARRPAIIEKNGVRVAMLGYSSVSPAGYEAGPNKVGVAPLRAHTYYRVVEPQPGLPPQVVTVPYEEDVEAMVEDITKAKKAAHVVVVSVHWGIHFIPRTVADYQPIIAKAAFAAGADVILGHHPHIPKAIAVHGGKTCFYSLSNFVMSTARRTYLNTITKTFGLTPDPDNPRIAFKGSDRSLIAKVVLTREGVKKVSFLPVLIDKQCRPEVLRHEDPRFDEAVKYLDWVSEEFDHKFVVEGDEVVVAAA